MESDWTPVGELTERNGKTVAVEHFNGDVRIVVRPPIKNGPVLTQLVFGGEQRDAFLELFAVAEQTAEDEITPPGHRRACCDHCNNSTGPDGHGYSSRETVHDGPCEQCAAERARREHDAGTGD